MAQMAAPAPDLNHLRVCLSAAACSSSCLRLFCLCRFGKLASCYKQPQAEVSCVPAPPHDCLFAVFVCLAATLCVLLRLLCRRSTPALPARLTFGLPLRPARSLLSSLLQHPRRRSRRCSRRTARCAQSSTPPPCCVWSIGEGQAPSRAAVASAVARTAPPLRAAAAGLPVSGQCRMRPMRRRGDTLHELTF